MGPNRPVDAQSGISVDTVVFTTLAVLPATGVEGQQVVLQDGAIWLWIDGAWKQSTVGGLTKAEADTYYRTKPSFVFSQGVASALWTIAHNLGTYPAVTILDSTGSVVECDVKYIDSNTITVAAARPFSGQAILT
jgi:hypothetical protein